MIYNDGLQPPICENPALIRSSGPRRVDNACSAVDQLLDASWTTELSSTSQRAGLDLGIWSRSRYRLNTDIGKAGLFVRNPHQTQRHPRRRVDKQRFFRKSSSTLARLAVP